MSSIFFPGLAVTALPRHSDDRPSDAGSAPQSASSGGNPFGEWWISLLFWSGLGLAVVLSAVLVLSPGWLESERLRERYAANAQTLSELKHSIAHLAQVAKALETDPDYVARVAASELGAHAPGEVRIPLEDSLEYDSRLSVRVPAPPAFRRKGHNGAFWVEAFASSSRIRRRLMIGTCILIGVTFLCFNESFFHGGVRQTWRIIVRQLRGRYRTGPRPAA